MSLLYARRDRTIQTEAPKKGQTPLPHQKKSQKILLKLKLYRGWIANLIEFLKSAAVDSKDAYNF